MMYETWMIWLAVGILIGVNKIAKWLLPVVIVYLVCVGAYEFMGLDFFEKLEIFIEDWI